MFGGFLFLIHHMRGRASREAKARCLSILHKVVLEPLAYLFVCICSCYNSFGSLLDCSNNTFGYLSIFKGKLQKIGQIF